MDQRGQATPLLAVLILAIGGLMLGLAHFGAIVTHRAQSQAAADAAALAGAAEGPDAAKALATANGASVLAYRALDGDVEVRAGIGASQAVARARRAGRGGGIGGWVGVDGSGGGAARLSPGVQRALAAAAELLHQPVPIAGGAGRAVTVPEGFVARLVTVAARVGLCQPSPQTDPVRFVLCPDRAT
ncbi:MAG: hypothetical protein QOI47_2208 [Actinomycetota bacterium]|nr:hypothetical protein [Actinomycetota bacterium]